MFLWSVFAAFTENLIPLGSFENVANSFKPIEETKIMRLKADSLDLPGWKVLGKRSPGRALNGKLSQD